MQNVGHFFTRNTDFVGAKEEKKIKNTYMPNKSTITGKKQLILTERISKKTKLTKTAKYIFFATFSIPCHTSYINHSHYSPFYTHNNFYIRLGRTSW